MYLPNQLFFVPGSDQYFTRFVQDYLRGTFRPDTALVLDEVGRSYLAPVSNKRLPEKHRIIGWLLVRTGK